MPYDNLADQPEPFDVIRRAEARRVLIMYVLGSALFVSGGTVGLVLSGMSWLAAIIAAVACVGLGAFVGYVTG